MQETLQQYEQLVESLERVVQADEGLQPSAPPKEGDEPPLQIILHNVHRYLMAVAANLDRLHEGVADARQQFLDKRKEVRQISSFTIWTGSLIVQMCLQLHIPGNACLLHWLALNTFVMVKLQYDYKLQGEKGRCGHDWRKCQ